MTRSITGATPVASGFLVGFKEKLEIPWASSIREYNRFSKGIYSFVGFKTRWFEYENTERAAGETKWSFRKLCSYSLDGIMAFSTAPLNFASVAGFVLCLVAFVMIGVVVIKTILWGDPVAGYPSLMSVILFIGGIQLFSIGILGKYLAKTYLETNELIRNHVLFGTDYYMTEIEGSERFFSMNLRGFLGERLWHHISEANPARYLNL